MGLTEWVPRWLLLCFMEVCWPTLNSVYAGKTVSSVAASSHSSIPAGLATLVSAWPLDDCDGQGLAC